MRNFHTKPDYRIAPLHQCGAALIISLIFLLLMTLIGITSMQTTTLQERMAGNARDRNLALQSAEAGLRQAEAWVVGSAANRATAALATPLANPAAWDGSSPHGTASGYTPALSSEPVFYAEPPTQVIYGVTATSRTVENFYPTTAYAEGGADTTVVILQTMVKVIE